MNQINQQDAAALDAAIDRAAGEAVAIIESYMRTLPEITPADVAWATRALNRQIARAALESIASGDSFEIAQQRAKTLRDGIERRLFPERVQ